MRWVLSRRQPPGSRLLLIESGSRSLIEGIVPLIRSSWGPEIPIDLFTCYGGAPAGLEDSATIFRASDYATPESRRQLVAELRKRDYAYAGMICSAEPIMTKWKWFLAYHVPAKFFVLNENGDYFWLNRENSQAVRGFALERLGLTGAGAIRTLGRLLVFPFSVLFLLLYACSAHARRALRMRFHTQHSHTHQ